MTADDQKRTTGLEPATFSLGSCRSHDVTDHCDSRLEKQVQPVGTTTGPCVDQFAKLSGQINDELARVVHAWPDLPVHIKLTILQLLDAAVR